MNPVCAILIVVLVGSVLARTEDAVIKGHWGCNFQLDNCGIENQPHMPSNFSLIPRGKLLDETGIYYLDLSDCLQAGARLIMPYFKAAELCLKLKVMSFGNSPYTLAIIQQDNSNRILFKQDKTDVEEGRWRDILIDAHLAKRPIRFFIEIRNRNQHSPTSAGFFALSEVIVFNSNCHNLV